MYLQVPCVYFQNSDKYWDNPKEFNPMRFEKFENKDVFMVFGKGNRQCLGKHLAYLELKTLILMIIKNKYTINVDQNSVHFDWITAMNSPHYKSRIEKKNII